MHLQCKAVVYTDLHMVKYGTALIVCFYGNNIAVMYSGCHGILRRHVDMSLRNDTSLVQIDHALRPYYCNCRGAGDIAGFPDRRLHTEADGVCSRYLHLGFASDRS